MSLDLEGFICDGALLFTVTSNGYKHLTNNLWTSLQRLTVAWQLCILCLDEASHTYFCDLGIPSVLFKMPNAFYHAGPAIYGSSPFKKLVAMKLEALRLLAADQRIQHLVYMDGDIVILKDPLPTIREYLGQSDLWFQCDGGAVDCTEPCPNPCTGLIALNLTADCRAKAAEIFKRRSGPWLLAETDQDYVQGQMRSAGVTFSVLPRNQFPNGIFLRAEKLPQEAQLIHFNYLVGAEKEATMRRLNLWFV